MTTLAVSHRRSTRVLVGSVIAALLAVFAVVAPMSSPARAASYDVYTVPEFYAAVTSVNAQDESSTIYIRADLDFASTDSPAELSSDVYTIIDGGGHTVSCSGGDCDGWLEVSLEDPGELAIVAITVTGFATAVRALETDLTIVNATFEGNGTSSADAVGYGGAALRVSNSTPAVDPEPGETEHDLNLSNVNFVNNVISGDEGFAVGVAVYVQGDVIVDNGSFSGNVADIEDEAGPIGGAAMFLAAGDVYITGTQFTDNRADGANPEAPGCSCASGGAIFAVAADLTLTNVTFEGNSTDGTGGAVQVAGADLLVSGGRMTDNEAALGGALYAIGSGVTLEDTSLESNFATDTGGGAVVESSGFSIARTTLTENDAPEGYGGAVAIIGAEGSISQSLFTDNSAGWGGAVYAYDSGMGFESSTLTGNTAWSGAAIQAEDAYVDAAFLTVTGNSIDAADDPSGDALAQLGLIDGAEVDLHASIVVNALGDAANCAAVGGSDLDSGDFNLVDDASCGLGATADTESTFADAMLGPLQFNGGPTWTMLPAPESAVVDAIDGEICPGGAQDPPLDQRGVEREQGDACDIGAVEIFEPIQGTVMTAGGPVEWRVLNAADADDPVANAIGDLDPAPPAGVAFPYGALGLEIGVWGPGWPADVQFATLAPTTEFWKLLWDEWVEYPATSQVQEEYTVWSFRLIDGGDGDNDGDDDAVIIDPAALGVAAAFTG